MGSDGTDAVDLRPAFGPGGEQPFDRAESLEQRMCGRS
jgi:hypothetical protein